MQRKREIIDCAAKIKGRDDGGNIVSDKRNIHHDVIEIMEKSRYAIDTLSQVTEGRGDDGGGGLTCSLDTKPEV